MNLFRARNGNSTNQKFSNRVGFDWRTRSDLWSGISRGRHTQGFHRPAIFSGRLAAALLLFLSVVCSSLFANIEITLKNDFIEQFKDRATISVSFVVDKAHRQPNPPQKDADLHAAGRADEVGLPMVAEIMNAASQKSAVDAIHNVEGTGNPVPLTGVWRIWCEHGGDDKQVQGEPLEPFDTTNPPHVFQIHPITRFNSTSILGSLHPIDKKFKTKDAETAFGQYEQLKSHITLNGDTTTILTTMAGYNYVEFVTAPLQNQHPASFPDGTGVLATVYDLNGHLLVHKRRMVFVKDSPEENALKSLKPGEGMHVLGVPRISLKLLSFRVAHHAENEQMLDWSLPYEVVIVGFYGKVPASDLE
jgi:hypothetical protein